MKRHTEGANTKARARRAWSRTPTIAKVGIGLALYAGEIVGLGAYGEHQQKKENIVSRRAIGAMVVKLGGSVAAVAQKNNLTSYRVPANFSDVPAKSVIQYDLPLRSDGADCLVTIGRDKAGKTVNFQMDLEDPSFSSDYGIAFKSSTSQVNSQNQNWAIKSSHNPKFIDGASFYTTYAADPSGHNSELLTKQTADSAYHVAHLMLRAVDANSSAAPHIHSYINANLRP